jgi:hypothetical protein
MATGVPATPRARAATPMTMVATLTEATAGSTITARVAAGQAGSPGRQGETGDSHRTPAGLTAVTDVTARITLFSRPGCHLCDDARAVIRRVAGDLGVSWEERDITLSAADMREYWDKIPVTLVDGVQHDFWRVSEARLRSALTASAGR